MFCDFEYCISAYSHVNLIISGQVLHGLHDHARHGGSGHDPQPDSRPDGGHARGGGFYFKFDMDMSSKTKFWFLFGMNISNTIHFMIFLRKKEKMHGLYLYWSSTLRGFIVDAHPNIQM